MCVWVMLLGAGMVCRRATRRCSPACTASMLRQHEKLESRHTRCRRQAALTRQAPQGVCQRARHHAGRQLAHPRQQLAVQRVPQYRPQHACRQPQQRGQQGRQCSASGETATTAQAWLTSPQPDITAAGAAPPRPSRSSPARASTWVCLPLAPHHLAQAVHGGGGVDGVHEVGHVAHNAQDGGHAAGGGGTAARRRAQLAGETACKL